jgi:prepilin signal peptidase PulO-like enzyme (type II secretory pathway)
MEFLNFGLIFILGTIIGSFLNVVIYRLGTGFSIHKGRSRCFSCNKTLAWYELIPLLSFFLQKGRCRTCHARLSLQYPLIEFLTGILFIFSAYIASFDVFQISLETLITFTFYAVVTSLLVVLFVYDLKHKILPSSILYSFVTISFIYALFLYVGDRRNVLDIFAGLILAAPIFILWFLSKGKWIGFADGVLFLGVGFLLGFTLGVHAFLFAFWVGALIALILTYLLPRRFSFGSELPFGPFIILATLFFLYSQSDILGVSLFYDLF